MKASPIKAADGLPINSRQLAILKFIYKQRFERFTIRYTTKGIGRAFKYNDVYIKMYFFHSLKSMAKRGLLKQEKDGRVALWSLGPLTDDLIDRKILG